MIDRRTVLRTLAATPLAGALGASYISMARPLARAGEAASWKQAFDEALVHDRRLLGWQGITTDTLRRPSPH